MFLNRPSIFFSEYCEIFGEKHKPEEVIVSKDCSGYCRCSVSQAISCVPMCLPPDVNCLPGMKKIPAFYGNNCTCPSWKCADGE